MNYNHLRYFSVLAQVEHYSVAAARLGITQPALSTAIRHLEDELGVELFEKRGRNIRLTEKGKFFQRKIDGALEDINAASQALIISRDNAPVVIRIGFVSGALQGVAAQQVTQYLNQMPRSRFHITEGSSKDLMDLLHQEKLDMAIVDVTARDRSLHFRKLRQRDFSVAVPAGHPLADMESVQVADLSEYPQIGFSHSMDRNFEDWASHPDTRHKFLCQVNSAQTAVSLVAAGVGIAVIPDECTLPVEGIRYIPLKNRHQALYMCIVYDRWLEPPVWEFVEKMVAASRSQ